MFQRFIRRKRNIFRFHIRIDTLGHVECGDFLRPVEKECCMGIIEHIPGAGSLRGSACRQRVGESEPFTRFILNHQSVQWPHEPRTGLWKGSGYAHEDAVVPEAENQFAPAVLRWLPDQDKRAQMKNDGFPVIE